MASLLRQVESLLRDKDMTGRTSAWAMATRRPRKFRRKVDAATRCAGVCPHTRPDLFNTHCAPCSRRTNSVSLVWMRRRSACRHRAIFTARINGRIGGVSWRNHLYLAHSDAGIYWHWRSYWITGAARGATSGKNQWSKRPTRHTLHQHLIHTL